MASKLSRRRTIDIKRFYADQPLPLRLEAYVGCAPSRLDRYCYAASIPRLEPNSYVLESVELRTIGGDAPKDFLTHGAVSNPYSARYIAKGPRKCGPRECVTEELISRIGHSLAVKVANSRLVRLPCRVGTDDHGVRFMSRYFLAGSAELIHGVELMAQWIGADRHEMEEAFFSGKGRKRRASERDLYRIDYIADMLVDQSVHGEESRLLEGLGAMLGFDALVGAQDHHPMNWGVIRDTSTPGPLKFAPIFDTARGLFWHHHDDQLWAVYEAGNVAEFVRDYANRSSPLIGHEGCSAKSDHFDLVGHIQGSTGSVASLRGPIHRVLRSFKPARIRALVGGKLFRKAFSAIRLEFIYALLLHRYFRLARLCEVQA